MSLKIRKLTKSNIANKKSRDSSVSVETNLWAGRPDNRDSISGRSAASPTAMASTNKAYLPLAHIFNSFPTKLNSVKPRCKTSYASPSHLGRSLIMQVMRLWLVAAKGASECCGICGERRGNCAAYLGLSHVSHLSIDAASVLLLRDEGSWA